MMTSVRRPRQLKGVVCTGGGTDELMVAVE
jgi:hypothetical protein